MVQTCQGSAQAPLSDNRTGIFSAGLLGAAQTPVEYTRLKAVLAPVVQVELSFWRVDRPGAAQASVV